jgi:hypothetical protein
MSFLPRDRDGVKGTALLRRAKLPCGGDVANTVVLLERIDRIDDKPGKVVRERCP